jgi:ATP-dependent DNA helicase Q4
MDDQLAHLPPALPGAVLHSGQQAEQAAATLDALRAGALKVLFVAPERLLSRRFLELAASLPPTARFTFACVDECHCVSEWSHNFRPAYYHLGRVLRDDLSISRVLALTATATRRTEAAVTALLGIPEAHVVRTACLRDNLRLTVSREFKRDSAVLAMLRPGGRLEHAKSVIMYASYKARCACSFALPLSNCFADARHLQGESDRLAQLLFTNGIPALSYHAGKTQAERAKAQSLFLSNRVRVVVATVRCTLRAAFDAPPAAELVAGLTFGPVAQVAFGMGIDKSDVSAVVNFGLPRSIEAFVQQVCARACWVFSACADAPSDRSVELAATAPLQSATRSSTTRSTCACAA